MANHHITYVLIIQTISMAFVFFPSGPLLVWQKLKRRWRAQESKRLLKRRTRTEKKLKKYWEIDIPKSQ